MLARQSSPAKQQGVAIIGARRLADCGCRDAVHEARGEVIPRRWAALRQGVQQLLERKTELAACHHLIGLGQHALKCGFAPTRCRQQQHAAAIPRRGAICGRAVAVDCAQVRGPRARVVLTHGHMAAIEDERGAAAVCGNLFQVRSEIDGHQVLRAGQAAVVGYERIDSAHHACALFEHLRAVAREIEDEMGWR